MSLNEPRILVDDGALSQIELLVPHSTMALDDDRVHLDVMGFRRHQAR